MSGPLSERSCYQPNIPEETRRAAYVAFDEASDLDWQKRAVDAALEAAAPFLVAAERQRLHDRIEALADEWDNDADSNERATASAARAVHACAAEVRALVTTASASSLVSDDKRPEDHVTLFIDDMTALLNDCAQGGDIEQDGRPAYVAVWAVRELLEKAFAREIEWAATSDAIVRALHEDHLVSPGRDDTGETP